MRSVIERKYSEPKPRLWERIRCADCGRDLLSKSELRRHRGHEVVYLKKDGTLDD